ncbi:MAG TPA: nucleotide exchange factor GrpE [Gemmatimonadales bacterium]
MKAPDDRNGGGRTPADRNAYTTEDAFAPGGEPRMEEMPEAGVADAGVTPEAEAELAGGVDAGAPDGLQRELEEQRDRYLRLAAEYDNYRKRTQRERAEAGTQGQAALVKQLLDPLDDLDRVAHVDTTNASAASVAEGVEMVRRKFDKVLNAAGLEVVNPVDQPFDPNLHEALTTMPASSPEEDDTVGQVYQLGYVFCGQLLRPARVVVRQWNG